jgi:hypothetical protein
MDCRPTASIQPRRRLDQYKCKHKTTFQNTNDLGPRSGVGWNAVLGRVV